MISAARRRLGQAEFTALLAAGMSMTALGIDLLLPAFGEIRSSLGLPSDSTAVAGLITAYFLGLAVGQPLYGPASDTFGRKPLLYLGFAVYGTGALAAAIAPTLPLLLAARFLWGLGAAGSRVVVIAIIRDRYEGEAMSRATSLVMSAFMVVPVFAPALGAAALGVVAWRMLFVACAVAVGVLALWSTRLAETLPASERQPASMARLTTAAKTVVANRMTVGYALAMTAMYGSFTSYLGSSELFFGEVFGVGGAFPLYFGGLAVTMALAMLVNARIVQRVGSRRLSHLGLLGYLGAAVLMLVSALPSDGHPPLAFFLVSMAGLMCGHAILIPNFNALAMQPMGAVAGMASSLTGALQIAVGALIGAAIDSRFDGSILPFAVATVACALVTMALVRWAEDSPLVLGRRGAPTTAATTAATAAATPAATTGR